MEAALPRHAGWRGLAQERVSGPHDLAPWSAPRGDITLARVSQRLRFHRFVIDLAARELHDDGRLLQLSPKIFDCIAYLLENRERAVGRDELMAAVWGRADTADSQLGQAMLKARRALGDSGEAQHTIRTVAGFGYRWIAEVHEADAGASDAPPPSPDVPSASASTSAEVAPAPAPANASSPSNARARWIVHAIVAAGVLAALSFGAWSWQKGRSQATPASTAASAPAGAPDTIVVLPARVDAGEEWAWLRLGMMEFIATRLRAAGQTVAPSENVVSALRATTDPGRTPDAVRMVLKPRYVVVPSARRTDQGWTVSLELQDRDKAAREVKANGDDAMASARAASERLLDLLGRRRTDAAEAARWPSEELLSRIDAALLADDLDGARRLLQSAPPEQRSTPELRLRLAQVESGAGRDEVANADLLRLLADVPPETDPTLRARIGSSRGAILIRLGRAGEAEPILSDALGLLEGRNEPALLGKTHMRRGVARALQGNADAAMADFAQARIAMQLAADTLGLAQIELNEGALAGVRNHPADALDSFQRAELRFERFGISSEWVTALANQIVAHRVLLQPLEALAASQRSLALLGKLPSPDLEHLLKLRRAQAFVDNGRWSDAGMLLDELARGIDPAREAELAALTANERAALALARGDAEQAFALTEPTIEQRSAPQFASARSEAWFLAIRALRAQDRLVESGKLTQRYAAWAAQAGNTTFALHARLAEAEQAAAERRYTAADPLYEDALRAANAQNVPADIADVARSWATSLIARGELIRAAPVAGQLARFAAQDFGCALLQVRLYHALAQNEAWRSALEHARALAMERAIPPELAVPPKAVQIGSAAAQAGH